jgi:hypothetical protein
MKMNERVWGKLSTVSSEDENVFIAIILDFSCLPWQCLSLRSPSVTLVFTQRKMFIIKLKRLFSYSSWSELPLLSSQNTLVTHTRTYG